MGAWAKVWMVAGVFALASCTSSAAGGHGGTPSGSRPAQPSRHTSTPTPTSAPSSRSATTPPASSGSCAAGHAEVTVGPGDAVERRLCVRPGTVVTLVLKPRTDDRRWTALHSAAPVFVVVSGWQPASDGSARASLRCAGTRAGTARITATAKAPDVAGAARVAFTLDVNVVPYTTQG
ncbi:hypothetical protein [Streptomyces sp. NPDC088350]|uniref:hypothetical protein n=1 Tax=Streptomyces sp. NPDC088350 TaxID=3365854 RepID=UPI00382DD4B9